jgi:hypothetical protein
MRKNQDGTQNKQDTNIQDQQPTKEWKDWFSPVSTPELRALWSFKQWAERRPSQEYFALLPPAARMAVDAVAAVLDTLER